MQRQQNQADLQDVGCYHTTLQQSELWIGQSNLMGEGDAVKTTK